PCRIDESLPAGLDAFFERALRVKPAERFGSAEEMSAAFAQLVAGSPAPAQAGPLRASESGLCLPPAAGSSPAAVSRVSRPEALAPTVGSSPGRIPTGFALEELTSDDDLAMGPTEAGAGASSPPLVPDASRQPSLTFDAVASEAGRSPRRSRTMLAALAAAAALAAGGALLLFVGGSAPSPAGATSSAMASATGATAVPGREPSAPAGVRGAANEREPEAGAEVAPLGSAAPPPPRGREPTAAATKPSAASAPASGSTRPAPPAGPSAAPAASPGQPRPDCADPFMVDENGDLKPKPQCI
ncbi:MAG: hypothetical protein HY744_27835, partial [Deltaproteobacteria bacterium]|nr:hypothetical protein [Deltaproteobacteria bacterium]